MTVQQLCDLAVSHHQKGELIEAERLCVAALAAEPGNLTAGYLLGLLRFQQGRHEEAAQRIGAAVDGGLDAAEPNALFGLALQAAGRLEEAVARFDRAVALKPDHAQALFNRAVTLTLLGRLAEALDGYDRVLALAPGHAGALFNRGAVLDDLKRPEQALTSYDRALAAKPDFAEAWNSRGLTLQRLGDASGALASFDRALAIRRDFPEALVNRAGVLKDLGRPQEALAGYDEALALWPDFAEAWNNRGFVQQHLDLPEAATTSFERALALKPDYTDALFNLGSALCAQDRVAEGYAAFTRHAHLVHAAAAAAASPSAGVAHKLKHDLEQSAYLAGIGAEAGPERLHIEGGGRLAGPAINRASAADTEARWLTSQPQVVVIDDLLTAEALEALRQFCWGSAIWRGVYDNGYLGAMPEHGFACPLLAQITEELRDGFPAIFGGHPLNYLWAFKYDSQLDGIELHADRAAVNVNFWITPDEANLDPDSGGLVIWDAAAPQDWEYNRYNGDPDAARRFLEAAGAEAMTVPYRANRAVVFDSDLFHKTDRIAFKDGYLNRRINVTLLYGRRSSDNR